MFGYEGTAECCCKGDKNCSVIQLDCSTKAEESYTFYRYPSEEHYYELTIKADGDPEITPVAGVEPEDFPLTINIIETTKYIIRKSNINATRAFTIARITDKNNGFAGPVSVAKEDPNYTGDDLWTLWSDSVGYIKDYTYTYGSVVLTGNTGTAPHSISIEDDYGNSIKQAYTVTVTEKRNVPVVISPTIATDFIIYNTLNPPQSIIGEIGMLSDKDYGDNDFWITRTNTEVSGEPAVTVNHDGLRLVASISIIRGTEVGTYTFTYKVDDNRKFSGEKDYDTGDSTTFSITVHVTDDESYKIVPEYNKSIRDQFYGIFETSNETWNSTCDVLYYEDEATITVDTNAIEYVDDNVGVNTFNFDIRYDTDGNRRRFRPGEWFTEINEFTVGSHTIQYRRREKYCYPWECNLRKYPYTVQQLQDMYNAYTENNLVDENGIELEHPLLGKHCLMEIIVDDTIVWKAGTWDDIAEGCYKQWYSKFYAPGENTSSEGDDEQPASYSNNGIRQTTTTMYLIRRDKWIYVYLGNILATRFYDDCVDDYIGLTFHVSCGGSVGYNRRIEVPPCTFYWWKPDKWWLTKEYLDYLPIDASEDKVNKRMDELIISKEEKEGCPYPECCRYISNELKEYSESITAKIDGLPSYTYNDTHRPGNCKTTANININELNRTHKFKYSLCCGYQLQELVEKQIGTVKENCISHGSSCSAYYYNDYPLRGNVHDFYWTVAQGIVAKPVCLEAKYGEILNISFRNFSNYAGVEISVKPPYGTAKINKFGDVEFQMPTVLPFGVNVVRFEYTLYDIYGAKSRSTISIKLLETRITYSGDTVIKYLPNTKIYSRLIGNIVNDYTTDDDPIYKLKTRKNIHSDILKGDINITEWGDVYLENIVVGDHTGLEITEVIVEDQFGNECMFRLTHIVDTELKTQNILTELPNNVQPKDPTLHDDYDDNARFKKGERPEPKSTLLKVFPAAPYTIKYFEYYPNIGKTKLATVVAFAGKKGPLKATSSLTSIKAGAGVYIEGPYVYADLTVLPDLGEKEVTITVDGVSTKFIIIKINPEDNETDYYDPIYAEDYTIEDDNEAYDFELINTVYFYIDLISPFESAPGYWDFTDSDTVPFRLYWIAPKQIINLEDIIKAKFVHIPTISRPKFITEYNSFCDDTSCTMVAKTGDGSDHRYWTEVDKDGYFVKEHHIVDSDINIPGHNTFFYGLTTSYANLNLDEVTVKFGVGNDLMDCFNHDEQPFGGNVVFTVKEDHIKIEEVYTGEQDPNSGADIVRTIRTNEGSSNYTIVLEPRTHGDYRLNDSDIQANADCNCPRGVQSYWFTGYSLCADNNNDKYAKLKTSDECTPFNYAYDNYYNYWTDIKFSYRNGKAYISDGYHEYSDRPSTVDLKCNVTPADKTVWLELTVPDSGYSYPIASRRYITKYTIVGVSRG